MTSSANRFAHVKTFIELEEAFEYATSPENLRADGERTPEEAEILYKQLVADYNHRDAELHGGLTAENLQSLSW